ncbi:hypothetical protein [Microvirga massiliensis]|uniref:hypothetical protein n=1 Tax=Microvirga massiliensis TaxID=1033741 RepID=UPI0011CBD1B4|nr:hypothetical protein [Microvirga massiliensis]
MKEQNALLMNLPALRQESAVLVVARFLVSREFGSTAASGWHRSDAKLLFQAAVLASRILESDSKLTASLGGWDSSDVRGLGSGDFEPAPLYQVGIGCLHAPFSVRHLDFVSGAPQAAVLPHAKDTLEVLV